MSENLGNFQKITPNLIKMAPKGHKNGTTIFELKPNAK